MDLSREIYIAEKAFLSELEKFFISVTGEKELSSHGLNHHRRVWRYAKELLTYLSAAQKYEDNFLTSKLIIGCYLHDSGMSVDPGPVHGHLSREICEEFLNSHPIASASKEDLLHAIEKHDDKSYGADRTDSLLLVILSAADDLDAFGYTGIYRYLEIYSRRGIPLRDIGHLVIGNASSRHENFARRFSHFQPLADHHARRFGILIDFFKKYNDQSEKYAFGSVIPHGYCGVAEIISGRFLPELTAENIGDVLTEVNDDSIMRCFFRGLEKELSF